MLTFFTCRSTFFGRTFELTPVVFDAEKKDIGRIINVEIESVNQSTLFGSKINSNTEAAA